MGKIKHETIKYKGKIYNTYKELAKHFTEKEAIKVRDELNEKRKGKRYLCVISKV